MAHIKWIVNSMTRITVRIVNMEALSALDLEIFSSVFGFGRRLVFGDDMVDRGGRGLVIEMICG